MTDLDYELLEKFRKADFFRNSKTVENFIQFSYKFLQDNPNQRDDVLEISKKIKKGCFERILEQREKEKTHVNASDLVRINMRSATLSDNYWNVIRLESLYVFESFIIAMERFRPPAKRFYNPRKMTLSTVVEDLQGLEDGKYKFYGLSMPSRTGKALEYNTPVLTADGWKKHGELAVGDRVIGMDGRFKRVLAVHPPCKMEYRIKTSDNEEFICHGNHEWVVKVRGKKDLKNVSVNQMAEHYIENDGHRKYGIPIREVVEGEEKQLNVHPYVLGVWLGDGRTSNPDIANPDMDKVIVDRVVELGYPIAWSTRHKTTGVMYYGFKNLRKELQTYDMCHSRKNNPKYIPDEYLTASKEQRLQLLAGLLDTDGNLRRSEHRYDYSTTNPRLRDGFIALVNSFGWRTCVVEEPPRVSTSGIHGRNTVYVISFNPTSYIPCQVERKQLHQYSKQRMTSIDSIEKLSPEEEYYGNCITVEGGTYRVGLKLIPTHNSTICLLFLSWIALKRPNSHNALGGHSGILARGFFKELLNFITSEEYAFKDLYEYHHPNQTILQDKSADEYTINLGSPDRFSTITCRGIDGTWTGAVDVSKDGYLYVDDLVRDREHSLSPVRMENTYQEYLNKMVDRKNDGARELMVGTRWSVEDPLGRIEARFMNDPQYSFRKIPALNENDNSNFNYTRNGFSSEYYIDMREKLDKAEWLAKFQQAPFVREGLTFPVEELRFFDGNVPDDEHRTLAAIDPAFGSGDSLSMPICMDFGDNFKFVIDWVHDSRTIAYTIPLIADKIEVHHITEIQIEKNRGGDLFADKLQKELDDRGIYFCKINLRNAPVKMSKEDKISGYSDFIKRHLQFLKPSKNVVENVLYRASDQYRKALDEMTMFSAEGRNPHDDAADAITQLAMMFELKKSRQATITRSWI